MLKPFIYYSANYKYGNNNDSGYNFVASYTLDNYLTVYGRKGKSTRAKDNSIDGYTDEFSKSGYLIDTSNNKVKIEGDLLIKGVQRYTDDNNNRKGYTKTTAESYEGLYNLDDSAQENTMYLKVNIGSNKAEAYNLINYYGYKEDEEKANYNGSGYYISEKIYDNSLTEHNEPNLRIQTGDDIIEDSIEIQDLIANGTCDCTYIDGGTCTPLTVTINGIPITDSDAKEYYIKAYFFSEWIKRNLGDVKENTIQNNITQEELNNNGFAYNINFGESEIFNINNTDNNPEEEDSAFSQHKRAVIKNSIQYNLNTAISTYNTNHNTKVATEYQLPVMTNDDWENILNNICMVAFMQGMPCGTTYFNSYAVVKSNNNNTAVSLENIYFTTNIGDEPTATGDTYHKIDCKELGKNNLEPYEADQSAEFKYDAKKLNSKIDTNERIVCFYDDSTNTYYNAIDIGGDFTIGEEIINPSEELTKLATGSEVKYLYDHKNEGCYECIIGGNYKPVVKYYKGELYATYITEYGETLIYDDKNNKWIYENGLEYSGTRYGYDAATGNISKLEADGKMISNTELNRRRTAMYIYIAKIRNNLYKTNAHVNR